MGTSAIVDRMRKKKEEEAREWKVPYKVPTGNAPTPGVPTGGTAPTVPGTGGAGQALTDLVTGAGFDMKGIGDAIQEGGNTSALEAGVQTGDYTTLDQVAKQGDQQVDTTGKVTTSVDDTLGLGDLVQGAGQGQADLVGARQQGLQGIIESGGDPNLNANVRNAVNASLSGPGMTGAGSTAKARAAGMAAQGIAQNATQNQLGAASLAGQGSGLEGLVSAGRQLLGGSQDTTGSQSTNFSEIIDNLTQGTASGSNMGISFGETPQQTTKGGKLVCAALTKLGLMSRSMFDAEKAYIRKHIRDYRYSALGYMCVAPAFALWTLHSISFAQLIAVYANGCSRVLAHRHNRTKWKLGWFNWLCYGSFRAIFGTIGWFASLVNYRPVVKNVELKQLMLDFDDYIEIPQKGK